MSEPAAVATIIISPRDRYSGLVECIEGVYRHTAEPIELWVLDLDYPRDVIEPAQRLLEGRPGARIVRLGLMTPMDALRAVRDDLRTEAVVLLDNDSRVSAGWLPPLLAAVREGAAVASPLVLEREGVDRGNELRNHLYTGELRTVEVEGCTYLIEHKSHRRAPLEQIPRDRVETNTFELHCVMFSSAAFRAIELPSMVIREHLDIALQLRTRGERMLVEPASVITFDNLGTRMRLSDMRFFFYRWNPRLTRSSSRLFEQRWGYRFYSEQSMYNWVVRRKAFLVARWLGLPIGLANRVTGVVKRLFCRDWDPLPDAEGSARSLLAQGMPPQHSHAIR